MTSISVAPPFMLIPVERITEDFARLFVDLVDDCRRLGWLSDVDVAMRPLIVHLYN